MADKATLMLLAEYIIEKPSALEHILAYHKSFLEHNNINKSGSAEALGIARGTLYRILRGDDRVSIGSLKAFLFGLENSRCPVPKFRFMFAENCKNCPDRRLMEIFRKMYYKTNSDHDL